MVTRQAKATLANNERTTPPERTTHVRRRTLGLRTDRPVLTRSHLLLAERIPGGHHTGQSATVRCAVTPPVTEDVAATAAS